MKKSFTIYNLFFEERLSGLLLLLFVFANSFDRLFYSVTQETNSREILSYTGLNVNDPFLACKNAGLASFSTG